MGTCGCDDFAAKFDEAYAAGKLTEYRSRGPDRSTLMLLDAILTQDVSGRTLLDIGGGVGAVQHALLRAGVSSAQEVEASSAYAAACQAEAQRQGHAERISHLAGAFDAVEDAVAPTDIVTLDRSVCCWRDPLHLIERSAAKSTWLYGLVLPRDTWWVRYGWRNYGNLKQIVKRSGLRLSAPRTHDVEAILEQQGFRRLSHAETGVWQMALYLKG